jgi:hypothetical protein
MADPGGNTSQLAADASSKQNPVVPASNTPSPGPEERHDPLNPLRWEVPALCKDCDKRFRVPFRHFQAGVVFHCPHCHGSYVPTSAMYRQIREAFAAFEARMKQAHEHISPGDPSEAAFRSHYETEYVRFSRDLEELARRMWPAGKMVRRHGIGAMFT